MMNTVSILPYKKTVKIEYFRVESSYSFYNSSHVIDNPKEREK